MGGRDLRHRQRRRHRLKCIPRDYRQPPPQGWATAWFWRVNAEGRVVSIPHRLKRMPRGEIRALARQSRRDGKGRRYRTVFGMAPGKPRRYGPRP